MRIPRQFEKPYALFQVGLIGQLVAFDLAQAAVLLGPPFRGHAFEEGAVHAPVELVYVHRMDTVLEPVVLGFQAGNRRLVLAVLVGMARVQRGAHPIQHLVVEAQAPEKVGELPFEDLLPDVGLLAFPLVAGAVVVDVSLLLDLTDDRAAAMAARNQPREGEIVLHPAMLLGVPAVEHALHPLPQLARDERLVLALVQPAVPLELAFIEPVAQDAVHRADRHWRAAPAIDEPRRPHLLGRLFQ